MTRSPTPHQCPSCRCPWHDTNHPGRWNRDAPGAGAVVAVLEATAPKDNR